MKDAACLGVEGFVPHTMGSSGVLADPRLIRLCVKCPVFDECIDLSEGMDVGLWAGIDLAVPRYLYELPRRRVAQKKHGKKRTKE